MDIKKVTPDSDDFRAVRDPEPDPLKKAPRRPRKALDVSRDQFEVSSPSRAVLEAHGRS